MPTAAEQKEIKAFVKANAKGLGKLADRELGKGSADLAVGADVTKFLQANQKKWYLLWLA
tara:strand:+ start:192 stop:371 length:180 start_codon:yes stop_codon:yes gene_type:complete